MRDQGFREILARDANGGQRWLVTVNLLLHVSRGEDNRLSGTVRSGDRAEEHPFSGTLELMRVFEELVPAPPGLARSGDAEQTVPFGNAP